MRASYNKLQTYFEKELPEPKKLAELLTFHSYEVEAIEKTEGDYIFDIDVLPNRANDSSSEGGVAKEVSAILNISLKKEPFPKKESNLKINISVSEINKLLGSNISGKEIEDIFNRLGFRFDLNKEEFMVTPPFERTDLKIKVDLIEEVGRIYGYENIEAKLPEKLERAPKINKKFHYANKIRDFLVGEGFSEVLTYSFLSNGEVEIEKPLASDKNFLRTDLFHGLDFALQQNNKNRPLLESVDLKIFEIGNVFTKDGEHILFGISCSLAKGDSKRCIEDLKNKLSAFLNEDIGGKIIDGNTFETNFDELIEKLPEPSEYEKFEKPEKEIKYKPISPYPFALRDIAVWVPKNKTSDTVLEIIRKEAGDLLVNTKLFDEFPKDTQVSYAFNLVFQSQEKTLSDEEINKVMEKITNTLNNTPDWQVR